jgi:hypothetical protein
MEWRFRASRLAPSAVSLFGIVLMGSVAAGLRGGPGGFVWALEYGACGPLGSMLIPGSALGEANALTAAALVGVVVWHWRSGSDGTLLASLFVSAAWPLLGWGAGV